jgi:ankyrin repeat protein
MKILNAITLLLLVSGLIVRAQTTNAPKDDVNARGLRGWTALHFAALNGNYKAAETLLASNADVNAKGDDGATPLHLTTECQARWVDIAAAHTQVTKLLLDHQADVNAMDNNGQTPLHWAMTRECPAALEELLRQHGGQDKPPSYLSPYKHRSIQAAIQSGDLESIKELLKSYPNLITNKVDGSTLLHFATFFGDTNAVKVVLSFKEDDVNSKDTLYGQTPLFAAVCRGEKDMVEFLIAKKANVNARDKWGLTPLHYAAAKGYIDMAKILLAHKAKVNAKSDSRGETPVHRAIQAGHKEMVSLLRLHGGYNSPVIEYGPGP